MAHHNIGSAPGRSTAGPGTTSKGHSVTLTAHGDGTYHTAEQGQVGEYLTSDNRVEHPSFGHALMHIAKQHGPAGDHLHIHGHADGYTTHHVMEGGDVQGPEEHSGITALRQHVGDTLEGD